MDSCDHIVGLSDRDNQTFTYRSEVEFPVERFNFCPHCGAELNWSYMERVILFK